MRRLAAALFALAGAFLAACAPAPEPAGEPALWRIADADSEIWLFGTVHVLPPALAWRGEGLNAAFAAADEVVVETDVGDPTIGPLTRRHGLLPAGERLSDLLPLAERERLRVAAARLGLDPAALELLRPWLAASRLAYAHALAQGQDPAAGVEAVLVPEARAAGKPVLFLETPEQQIRTLADLEAGDQLAFLAASLTQIESDEDSLARLQAAWAAGDVTRLAALARADLSQAGPRPYHAIITARNQSWALAIEQRLAGAGGSFYAVGAAHLVGEGGVVALLRERGIDVEGP